MSSDKTAVLFFSRTLNDEYGASSFGLNREGFSSLYKFFVNKTLKTVEESGLPLVEAYSNEQVGDTFSERLINSLESVSQKGFERVIIIGNDAPELSVKDIQSANTALDRGLSVLGRDKRGGVYLIGLDLKKVKSSTLRGIQWHSANVHHQLSLLLGDVHDLSDKCDVNQTKDLKRLLKLKDSLSQGVLRFLKLIFTPRNEISPSYLFIQYFILTACLDRGPPRLAY